MSMSYLYMKYYFLSRLTLKKLKFLNQLRYAKGIFLLTSYVVPDYDFENVIFSILNLHVYSFICFI